MEPYLASHLDTVRALTLRVLDATPEELADRVPEGYANSIRWNLGHIVYIQERLAYEVAGESIHLSENYARLFAAGTKPADWTEEPPSLLEIREQLVQQTARIKESHQGNLNVSLPQPFTNKSGITFDTVGGCLLFSCFHEALHLDTIRHYLRQFKSQL